MFFGVNLCISSSPNNPAFPQMSRIVGGDDNILYAFATDMNVNIIRNGYVYILVHYDEDVNN